MNSTILCLNTGSSSLKFALFDAAAARHPSGLPVALLRGEMDALVFTGGIGTHQPAIRAAVVQRLAWLGLALDAEANASGHLQLASSASRIPILAMATDEEAVMAAQAAALATSNPASTMTDP